MSGKLETKLNILIINKTQLHQTYFKEMKDVKIVEQLLKDKQGNITGKVAILLGGLNSDNPKEHMDSAVSKYVEHEPHNQFVEIHLDNPWTRVVIRGINNIEFRDMTDKDSLKSNNE